MDIATHHRSRTQLALSVLVTATLSVALVSVPTTANAAVATVATEAELTWAFADAATTLVTLGSDITVSAAVLPVASTSVVLDLNGHTLDTNSIVIASGKSLTVQSSGTAGAAGVLNAVGTGADSSSIPAIATTSATFTVNSGTVNASADDSAAAIGGGQRDANNGGTTVVNGGSVNATTSGRGSAIGGAYGQYDFGSITVNGGTVDASSSGWGAAALGGATAGYTGKISITGGDIHAVASGKDSAAISSGSGIMVLNLSLVDIDITGGTVVAESGSGAAAIGGGEISNGANVTIGKDANVTVSSTARTVIGGGSQNSSSDYGYYPSSLTVAGSLTIASGQLALFSDQTATVASTGIIQGAGSITGSGTVINNGAIRNATLSDSAVVSGGLTISGHNYLVSFDPNFTAVAPDTVPETETVRVYATTFADGGRAVPVLARAGWSLEGFHSAADGSGSTFSAASAITADTTVYAQWVVLAVTPSAPAVTAGGSVTFATSATGPAGQSSHLVSSATTLTTDDPGDVVTGSSIEFHKAGTRTVTATYGSAVETTVITVSAGALSSLIVTPSAATVTTGETVTLTTEGFDAYGNSLGDFAGLLGYENSATGTGAANTFEFIDVGVVTFRVSPLVLVDGALAFDSSATLFGTATVTVIAGPASFLVVDPGSATTVAGGTRSFSVDAYDRYGNYLGNQTGAATFSTGDPTDVVTGSSIRFSHAGYHQVTASIGSAVGFSSVDVTAGPAVSLTVTPSATTVTAGESLSFTAVGTDAEGNDLGDITAATTFATGDAADDVDGSTITFHSAGQRTITATSNTGTTTVTVTVEPGVLASTTIDPSSSSVAAGEVITFTVQGFDAQGNPLGDVTSDARFVSSNAKDSLFANAVKFSSEGSRTITATVGTITVSVSVSVTRGNPERIFTTASATSVEAGNSLSFTTEERDLADNPLGDVTASTTLVSSDPSDVIAGNSITFTTAGTHTITAFTPVNIFTLTIDVTTGPIATVTIDPASSTVAAGESQVFTVQGFDAFGNPIGDVTASATFSSDILRDTVTGNSVRFANVGKHTIAAQVKGASASSTIEVTPGALASFALTPSTATATAGDTVDFRAEGFDSSGNSLGDFAGLLGYERVGAGVSSTTSYRLTEAGVQTFHVSLLIWSGGVSSPDPAPSIVGTATVTVAPGPITTLAVAPSTSTVVAGSYVSFTAEGFDEFGNSAGDQTTAATFASDTSTDTVSGARVRFSKAGIHQITASLGPVSQISTVDVAAGSLATISLISSASTATAGDTLSFSAWGFDDEGNGLGDVSASTAFATSDADDVVTGSFISFHTSGPRTITATNGSAADTITVSVTPSALARITIDPDSARVIAGNRTTFTVQGFDALGNAIGDVTSAATFTSDITTDSVSANSVRFSTAGVHRVTATVNAVAVSGEITVTTGALASIITTPSATSVIAGGSLVFTTEGFDGEGNSLGDISSSTSLSSVDPTDAVRDSSITFATATTHTITAVSSGFTTSVTLSVTAGPLASVTVVPAATTATAGDRLTFTVEGFDGSGNALGDQSASAVFSSDTAGDTVTGNTVRLSRAGVHVVTATIGSLHGTSNVTVDTGPLTSTITTPSASTVVAGGSLRFSTEGFDSENNSLGDLSSTTTLTTDDLAASVRADTVSFATSGIHTVTATTTGSADVTLTVEVTPGAISSMTIETASATVTAGDSLPFTVLGFDALGNLIGDVTTSATFVSDNPRDVVQSNLIRFARAGTHTVTATAAGVSASSAVRVVAGALASIVTTPSSTSVIAGGSLTLATSGFDAEGNELGDQTAGTQLTTGDTTDSISGNSIRFTTAGTHVITSTIGSAVTTTRVSVAPNVDEPGAIALHSSALTVSLGGSITVNVTAVDEFGNDIGSVTDRVVLSSNYDVDIIEGNTVTFPHASEHIITAALGSRITAITVEVVEPTVSPTPTPTVSPASGTNADADATATPTTTLLPKTGTDAVPLLAGGLLLFSLGAFTLLLLGSRRRRS